MNILMFTNTFTPHVGGVAASVQSFTDEYRRMGHRVIVVAPEFDTTPVGEEEVIRLPALQRFNGSDFSVRLPIPANFAARLGDFQPDIIHSHHPFLLGDTALRMASLHNVPIVFTHHTLYEQYTHYVPGDASTLQRFVIQLATGYANLCNAVIAPSESVKEILESRGVTVPVKVIPTGISVERFSRSSQEKARKRFNLPQDAYVVGHVGRLAREKNLLFLSKAIIDFLRQVPNAYFLLAGDGQFGNELRGFLQHHPLAERIRLTGSVTGEALVDAYHAMDVFAFASKSETQGIVLSEAMAAGKPVIALDASGVREVVEDGVNGILLQGQVRQRFTQALFTLYESSPEEKNKYQEAAKATAQRFSTHSCAEQALLLYESLQNTAPESIALDESAWGTSLRYIETEWALQVNRAESVGATLSRSKVWRSTLVKRVRVFYRMGRRVLNRIEWKIRRLKLPVSETSRLDPGLILLQIDGLSKKQFENALAQGKLPFLRKLLKNEGYYSSTLYSGIPSTTAAVQAELFYGRKTAVPAFAYYRRENKILCRMFDFAAAHQVEEELSTEDGLLEGGSSYSNIYGGAAAESHFCPATFSLRKIFSTKNVLSTFLLIVFNPMTVVRLTTLLVLEFFLGVIDALHGIVDGQPIGKELKFIASRLILNIFLRELITTGAAIDAARGLRCIHANFIGYDEHAHRRGPNSAFAHWPLKGIDDAVKKIWLAGKNSSRRDYEIWIYSDHGQEEAISFEQEFHTPLTKVLEEVMPPPKSSSSAAQPGTTPTKRTTIQERSSSFFRWFQAQGAQAKAKLLRSAAAGPLGHLYHDEPLRLEEKEQVAKRLTQKGIPLVFYRGEDELHYYAYTSHGNYLLPDDRERVLGKYHPFLDDIAKDLLALVHHKDAGDLIISGWRTGKLPLTFHEERGAHGGVGTEETQSFILLPQWLQHQHPLDLPWRPSEVREEGLHYLRSVSPQVARWQEQKKDSSYTTLRLITYNVHSCVGTDKVLSPSRVARLLGEYVPDVVALQELDIGRARTEHDDQAHLIAEKLKMYHQFHPALQVEEEQYGDAILSRYSMHTIRKGALPRPEKPKNREPRGALWVEVQVEQTSIQIINTHFGLGHRERKLQAEELITWVEEARTLGPLIVCGDLNAFSGSAVYNRFRQYLTDVEKAVPLRRPSRTWPSPYPLWRIDYIFVSEEFRVKNVFVPRTHLARVASDHLPVIVDLELPASLAVHPEERTPSQQNLDHQNEKAVGAGH